MREESTNRSTTSASPGAISTLISFEARAAFWNDVLMSLPERTALFAEQQKLGARMTNFAGFEMPLQYSGIIEEHMAVRRAAGIFDLSHMGEFEISGPHALALLERALTNSAARLREGQAQYTLLCAHDGGTIDDLIAYRLGTARFMLCVNASNIETDR